MLDRNTETERPHFVRSADRRIDRAQDRARAHVVCCVKGLETGNIVAPSVEGNRGELRTVVDAEVLKRNNETLIERVPQSQLGSYATLEPRQNGFAVGAFRCCGQSEQDLRFEVIKNVIVRLRSRMMELVHDDHVVRIGLQRGETAAVERLNRGEDVTPAAWLVRADEELAEITIAERSTVFCEALLEDLFAMRYEQQ